MKKIILGVLLLAAAPALADDPHGVLNELSGSSWTYSTAAPRTAFDPHGVLRFELSISPPIIIDYGLADDSVTNIVAERGAFLAHRTLSDFNSLVRDYPEARGHRFHIHVAYAPGKSKVMSRVRPNKYRRSRVFIDVDGPAHEKDVPNLLKQALNEMFGARKTITKPQ